MVLIAGFVGQEKQVSGDRLRQLILHIRGIEEDDF
jgi:hypothetical protein